MKKFILIAVLASFSYLQNAFADVRVNGYYRDNGTYVEPHYRTNPDSSTYNNYSSGYPNPHKGY